MCLHSKKQVQDRSKEFQGNKNNIEKIKVSWKSHRSQRSLHKNYGRPKAEY